MSEVRLKQKIDRMVSEILNGVVGLGKQIESVTLTGSYVSGKISLKNPNINILVFVKPKAPADFYLKIGRILYQAGNKYSRFFRFRVEPFPFRFAQPIGKGDLEVSVNLNLYEVVDKDLVSWITPQKKLKTPFGAPEPLMQGFQATRKVVFGRDVLGEMKFQISRKEILLGIIREFPLFRLQLTRAPMTYDIEKDYELLATEAMQIGKACLRPAVGIFLDEKSVTQGKQVKILADKKELLAFLKKSGPSALVKWAEIVINAGDNFSEIKKDKKKTFELYQAAFNILETVFDKAMTEFKNQF